MMSSTKLEVHKVLQRRYRPGQINTQTHRHIHHNTSAPLEVTTTQLR